MVSEYKDAYDSGNTLREQSRDSVETVQTVKASTLCENSNVEHNLASRDESIDGINSSRVNLGSSQNLPTYNPTTESFSTKLQDLHQKLISKNVNVEEQRKTFAGQST